MAKEYERLVTKDILLGLLNEELESSSITSGTVLDSSLNYNTPSDGTNTLLINFDNELSSNDVNTMDNTINSHDSNSNFFEKSSKDIIDIPIQLDDIISTTSLNSGLLDVYTLIPKLDFKDTNTVKAQFYCDVSSTGSATGKLELYNETDGVLISDSKVDINNSTYQINKSIIFDLDLEKTYNIYMEHLTESSEFVAVKSANIKIYM